MDPLLLSISTASQSQSSAHQWGVWPQMGFKKEKRTIARYGNSDFAEPLNMSSAAVLNDVL